MSHSWTLVVAAAAAISLAACGGGNNSTDEARGEPDANNPLLNSDVRPQPLTATGCLTASNGRYVVTALDDTAATPTTVTYQLSGGDESDLQQHVNREVRIAGEADPPQIADVRDIGTPAVGTGGSADANGANGVDPQVRTQQAMRFEVRHVKVSSVTPTGDECPTGQAQTPAP